MNARTLVFSMLLGASPLTALAAEPPAAAKDAAVDAGKHLSGFELMIRPGFGSATGTSPVVEKSNPTFRLVGVSPLVDKSASPYGSGFIGQAMVGFRFHPIVSAGFRVGYRASSATALSDGSTDLARQAWEAGLYVRAYPLALTDPVRKYIDPWISAGASYMDDTQTYKAAVPVLTQSGPGTVPGDWTIEHHGIAVPIGIGVDYRVLPILSVGPSFEYVVVAPAGGCYGVTGANIGNNYCTNSSPGSSFIESKSYGAWDIALDVRLTLP